MTKLHSYSNVVGMDKARRIMKSCTMPGCPELVETGRCARHVIKRPSGASYGSQWTALRRQILQSETHCRYCQGKSTTVDHIIPKAMGGTDARQNLQALCKSCHDQKTKRDTQKARIANTKGGRYARI